MGNHLTHLLENAVRKHTKPGAGVLLSGGIDSSTVAHFARHLPRFTGYYVGEPYDERKYAGLVAGPNWVQIRITPDDFLEHFDRMMEHVRPPYQGPGTFGQYMVARTASQYVDTLLSGEGGDELFGGYARLHLVADKKPPDGYENYQLPDDYPRDLGDALHYEYTVGLPALLEVDAQVTQANGITAVAPMLDREVTSFVLRQPNELRVGKTLLREAMRGLLPDAILNRTDKRGFPVPFVEWAQGPIREFVHDRIGYIPAPDRPWDRQWWLDLCEASAPVPA